MKPRNYQSYRCRKVSQTEKVVRPTSIKNKTSSKKNAVEGIEISYSGESWQFYVDTKFPPINQSAANE
jgi:hypothetical protein